jgi:hypothetical protein
MTRYCARITKKNEFKEFLAGYLLPIFFEVERILIHFIREYFSADSPQDWHRLKPILLATIIFPSLP